MRYQDNFLVQQYEDLHEKLLKCKKYMDPLSLPDIDYIKNVENELSLFEERYLREPMALEGDELSLLLPILKNNLKEPYDPAYFSFVDGNHLRPPLPSEDREMVMNVLLPRMGGFTGRIGVHGWSSVHFDDQCENIVTVSIERKK
jgi:hypothetical protein